MVSLSAGWYHSYQFQKLTGINLRHDDGVWMSSLSVELG